MVIYTGGLVVKWKMILNRKINFVDHFCRGGAFFGAFITGCFGDLVVHMIFALLVVNGCKVFLFKESVCKHIGKPYSKRLATKSKVEQKKIVCSSAFQSDMISNLTVFVWKQNPLLKYGYRIPPDWPQACDERVNCCG